MESVITSKKITTNITQRLPQLSIVISYVLTYLSITKSKLVVNKTIINRLKLTTIRSISKNTKCNHYQKSYKITRSYLAYIAPTVIDSVSSNITGRIHEYISSRGDCCILQPHP